MNSDFFRKGILGIPLILDINKIQQSIQPDNVESVIDTLLLKKFIKKYEGKCTHEGWIRPGSSSLIKRSLGKIEPEYFNNFIKIHCEFEVYYCHPQKEQKLTVTIDSINNLGIKCIEGPLYIILPKQHHILSKKEFEDLQEGDTILITIQYTRIRLFEPHIDIIATFDKKMEPVHSSRKSKTSDIEEVQEGGDDEFELSSIDEENSIEDEGIF